MVDNQTKVEDMSIKIVLKIVDVKVRIVIETLYIIPTLRDVEAFDIVIKGTIVCDCMAYIIFYPSLLSPMCL